ncbi:energy transducer TonB [Massilia sp. SR12]
MKSALFICIAAAAASLAAPAPCPAQNAKPEYAIKEDAPPTGSSILRKGVRADAIAINKHYHELSPEDRAYLHSLSDALPEGDEPPFPAKGLKPVHNAMYKAQAKLGVDGELHLLATVNSQGDVEEVKTFGSPSPEMTQYAVEVVLRTKFKPAVCAGMPCRRDFRFSYQFGANR